MDGGGQAEVALSADLMARAIIAAAQAYGDDPVRACTALRGMPKRCLPAAAYGIAAATDTPVSRSVEILGLEKTSTSRAKRNGGEAFERARVAAMRAAEYACWRPEAAESAIGADLAEPPEGDAGADDLDAPPWLRIPVEFDEPELEAVDPGGCAPPILVERHPEVAAPVKRAPAGPLTSWHGAPTLAPADAAKPDTPLGDLVLAAIADDALTSMGIASKIDRKEMDVVSTLKNLEHLGLVAPEPVENGPRKFAWRRIEHREDAA